MDIEADGAKIALTESYFSPIIKHHLTEINLACFNAQKFLFIFKIKVSQNVLSPIAE